MPRRIRDNDKVTWAIFMRSDDDLGNNPGLSSLLTGEPGTESPFELPPPGLFVEDNNVERFILHGPQVLLGSISHGALGVSPLLPDIRNYQGLRSENITTLEQLGT